MKINEFLADPATDLTGDANGDGTRNATQDEFIELVNETNSSQDISGWMLADGLGDRHIFPSGTIVPVGGAIVVFGGGSPTGNFGGAIVQTASTGALGLNNGGDTITLKEGSGAAIDIHTYGSEGGNNQSLSRNPDITGSFEQHTTATGSGSSLFSPGTQLNGTPFATSSPPLTPIYDIQGMGHISPLNGQNVTTQGIVTAVAFNGFYLQDATGDGNDTTSDAIFTFTGSSPGVNVGDRIEISGTVSEFTPGGTSTGNLSMTQISSPSISILSTGNVLPKATIVGNGGRTPIAKNIDDDNLTRFDPNNDGIDFYESLEGMWVQVNDAIAVSPTSRFGEIAVLADNGIGAGLRTSRGGIIIQPDDFNPERIIIDDGLVSNEPSVNVGDRFNGSIQGVFSYSFGNYKLLNTVPLPAATSGNLQAESTALTPENNALTVASFNVENLDPSDPDRKFSQLAQQIINNLASPDIIGLQEIQDNNGTVNDGIVAANQTYQKLIDAIVAAGGATYEYRQIDPINNADGGAPGSNIRVGFLFNPTRVEFSDRGTASPTDATAINSNGVLTLSPGRIDPNNPAFSASGGANFSNSRKSLAGEFVFNGERIFIINNHFKSKGGDTPLFGATQPADLVTETQRIAQAKVINDFTDSILNQDPNANIIVLGDFNDFQFSPAVQTLAGDDFTNLIDTLTPAERYTYNFEGNAQTLDHILVSDNLKTRAEVDVVHLNSEFASNSRSSDHDPIVSRFNFSPSIDGNIFGSSEVFLNGIQGDVRTQETNLGNLTADANLFIAKQYDSEVLVSIKNGGSIRDNIGISRILAGGTSNGLEQLPTEANPLVGKEAGDISQLDIENSLRFNNELSLITVTADELKNILEYAVSATEDGATPGQFPQIGGLRFSFDPDEEAIALDDEGNVLTQGRRIRNAAIVDEAGNIIDIISRNGQRVGNPSREIRLVTLNFLAGGGDGYPFDDYGDDKVDLVGLAVPETGVDVANFTDDGSEQDALAEYLAAKFETQPFRGADTSPQFDTRIQNLDFRNDTIFGVNKPQPKPDRRRNLERNNRNIFTVGGDRAKVTLRLSLTEINVSLAVNEIGVVKVDDDEGSIAGIKRGEAGYVQAALSRGKTVFSALPDALFESFNATRMLEFAKSDRLLFYMVQNSSTDIVLRDIRAGNVPPAVRFANGGNFVQINEDNSDRFSLIWDDGLEGTIKMRLEYTPHASMPLGIGLQGENERELIDLRGLGERSATITVRSEAAYSNTVGLYAIDDETGAIDGLNPGDVGYAEAAIARRVTQFGTNGAAANIEGLLAPFIIANATIEEFLEQNPDNLSFGKLFAYFPYLGANPDGFDHLRLLGDNLFGFEDLSGGGDGDFDDMVFQVDIA